MAEGTTSRGALSADAVREFWCWPWSGIAEGARRTWRELLGARDLHRQQFFGWLVRR